MKDHQSIAWFLPPFHWSSPPWCPPPPPFFSWHFMLNYYSHSLVCSLTPSTLLWNSRPQTPSILLVLLDILFSVIFTLFRQLFRPSLSLHIQRHLPQNYLQLMKCSTSLKNGSAETDSYTDYHSHIYPPLSAQPASTFSALPCYHMWPIHNPIKNQSCPLPTTLLPHPSHLLKGTVPATHLLSYTINCFSVWEHSHQRANILLFLLPQKHRKGNKTPLQSYLFTPPFQEHLTIIVCTHDFHCFQLLSLSLKPISSMLSPLLVHLNYSCQCHQYSSCCWFRQSILSSHFSWIFNSTWNCLLCSALYTFSRWTPAHHALLVFFLLCELLLYSFGGLSFSPSPPNVGLFHGSVLCSLYFPVCMDPFGDHLMTMISNCISPI